MNTESKAHQIARQSMIHYLDDERQLPEEEFNRIYDQLYRDALLQLNPDYTFSDVNEKVVSQFSAKQNNPKNLILNFFNRFIPVGKNK